MTRQPRTGGATPAETRAAPPRLSLAGRVTATFFVVSVLVVAAAASFSSLGFEPWLIFLLSLLIGLPLGAWLLARALEPLYRLLHGLRDGIAGFSDRDFSLRLASGRRDELGDLARLFNQVAELLHQERREVREKELLLATALSRSPVAILLFNPHDRVIFSNPSARRLLLGGGALEGRRFEEIRKGCPESMREILASPTDGIFTVQDGERSETFHLSQRRFQLNRRRHTLVQIQPITGELGRQEAAAWKRVIRVISHELNNSLAPVSSLVHSARLIAKKPEHAHRAEEVFTTIQERLDHLQQFIEGYARFARLPPPRCQEVVWEEVLDSLGEFPTLTVLGSLPARPGFFDRAQVQQLLVNLLTNAIEASEGPPTLEIRIQAASDGGTYLQVLDRGHGMDEETMKKALLPFYSTKKTGSGLGLALSREIVEAHGGKISLQGRDGGGTVVTCWLPPRPPAESFTTELQP